MKRTISLLLALVLCLTLLPAGVFAADTVDSGECGENVTWTLGSDGTLTISGTGEMADYNTAPWDRRRGDIRRVEIQSGVTSIGNYAFYGCKNLTSAGIPEGITSIGKSVFCNCSSLTSVSIPESVTSIGDYAFYNCSSLTSVSVPEGVASIGSWVFYGCSSLTSASIPANVTSIGDWAFYDCRSLTSVSIPASVTSIGDYAFYGCRSLTDVHYGGTEAQWSAIKIASDNKPLTSATIHYSDPTPTADIVDSGECGKNVTWTLDRNGVLTISGDGRMENYNSREAPWYSRREDIRRGEIQRGVTSIGANAFYECNGLTSVTIPDSVTYIGGDAFWGCTSLTSVTIPDSVTDLGYEAFSYCTSLTSVTIGNSVTSIGNYAFRHCISLTSVAIGNNVTSIGNYAFRHCISLTNITIPDSVISIGDRAFYGCTSLTSVTIPNSVNSIKYGAFYGCSSLTSVTIPNSVISIGGRAFYGCTSLTSVTISNSVTSIGDGMFESCRSLTSVTIPNNVIIIEDYAFRDCSSLTSVTIPDSVIYIGDYAFYFSDSLTDVYYGGTEAQWNKIEIDEGNDWLLDAAIHYNSIKSYTVTLNANLGRIDGKSTAKITVTNGQPYGTLPTPTREGYTFDGWFTKRSGGEAVTSDTVVSLSADQTLYAHWTFEAPALSVVQRGTTLHYEIENFDADRMFLLVADYDGSGRMLRVQRINPLNPSGDIPVGEAASHRVFLLDRTTYTPLCAAWKSA